MDSLRGARVTVMGLGRFGGGVGVTKFLVAQGAEVLVTDTASQEKLAASLRELSGLPVLYRLGEHRQSDFTDADLVVVNPAVNPARDPHLRAARAAGVGLTSEIRLLVERLPDRGRTIGVTGTAGKSTTTAMVGHILSSDAARTASSHARVHLGGNLGGSLLNELHRIAPDDWVVLELSSFMLEGLREDRWAPHVAVVTNFAPNHLDWHGSVEEYQLAKQAILDFQSDPDVCVLGPGIRDRFAPRVRDVRSQEKPEPTEIPLLLPGVHNQMNATLAAATVEAAIGLPAVRCHDALKDFRGLPHRLQFVCEHAGVRYFNDSKSTTPEASMLAVESFPPAKVHLILGGHDKGSDFRPLMRMVAERCAGVYTIGKIGDTIADLDPTGRTIRCGTLDRAMRTLVQRVRDGDVVLLSPGCASWDQFDNFEHRGQTFSELALRCNTERSFDARR